MVDGDGTGGFTRVGPAPDDTGGFKRAPGKGKDAGEDKGGSILGDLWRGLQGIAGRDVQMARQLPGALAQLPQVAAQQAQQNAGQTLAQRAANPQDMQTAASLAGTVGPISSPGTVMAAPAASAAQKLAQDFRGAGVPPSVPAVGQGRAAGMAAQLGRNLPFSPVRAGMQRGFDATRQAAGNIAAGLGTPQSAEGAGDIVRTAASRMAADGTQAARDYGDFFDKMSGVQSIVPTRATKTLGDIQGRFQNTPGLRGLFTSPMLQTIARELAGAKGGLSLSDFKELRTQIGYKLQNPTFGPGEIPRAQLKRLYGALTDDLQDAARKQGPEAVKALNRANANYRERMQTIDKLEPLIKGDAGEKTFDRLNTAARSSGGANAGLLRTLKANMAPQEWGDIAATMVRRLGEPSPGAKDVLEGEPFSVSSYVTNWNKLSDAAKDVLFGDLQMGSPRVGLERLARVAQAQKNVSNLANTSHSGEMVVLAGAVEEITRAIASGQVPWAASLGLAGSYGVSKLLMSPGFARWLYKMPKAVSGAPSKEIAVQRGAAALQQEIMNPNDQHTPGRPATAQKEPRVSDRIGAARKVGELSTQVYEAKRRGDLDEAQKIMRKLAAAQADYRQAGGGAQAGQGSARAF